MGTSQITLKFFSRLFDLYRIWKRHLSNGIDIWSSLLGYTVLMKCAFKNKLLLRKNQRLRVLNANKPTLFYQFRYVLIPKPKVRFLAVAFWLNIGLLVALLSVNLDTVTQVSETRHIQRLHAGYSWQLISKLLCNDKDKNIWLIMCY